MRFLIASLLCFELVCFGVGSFDDPAEAKNEYFMVIFASQSDPPLPRLSHTFATFAKAASLGAKDAKAKPEIITVSWLPSSGEIVPARLLPEPGTNFDLPATLKWAKAQNAAITAWGPFQVKKELFDRAQKQIERLNSGQISYKAVDLRFRGGNVSNCIHAVSDIETDGGLLSTGTAFGESASYLVVRHLQRWIMNPKQTHSAIAKELGLSDHDVRYQKLTNGQESAK